MLKTVSSYVNVIGALNYQGTWNASTNNPTLVSGIGTKGDYYVVSVAGSTTIDGQNLWGVGDWIVFNGTAWQRVDGGSTGNFTTISASGDSYFATSSGRVGVGTAAPSYLVSLSGQAAATVGMERNATSDTAGNSLTLLASGATSGATNKNGGALTLSSGTSTGTGGSAIIFSTATAGSSGTADNSPSEKMRIIANGNVGIGTNAPNSPLEVKKDGDVGFGAVAVNNADAAGASSRAATRFVTSAGDVGYVGAHGAGTGPGIGFPSTMVMYGLLSNGVRIVASNASGSVQIAAGGAASNKIFLNISPAGNVVCNNAAIATNATDGFLYVPSCAGTPTGTPTAFTGRVPIVVDSTNNKLYFYSGAAWRDAGP